MSNGIGKNPLNDISKIYLTQIAEKKDDSYLETDMKKRQKNNEKAIADMKKVKDDTVPRWMKESELEEVTKMGVHAPHEVPSKNLKKLVSKAVRRIDADVDGDVDTDDPKSTEMGEFVPSPDGKKKIKTKVQRESFSNWRRDLIEVMNDEDDEDDDRIDDKKKVDNKKLIKINPKLGEAIEAIGGTLIEMVEIEEGFVDPEEGEAPSGRRPLDNVIDHPNKNVRKKAIKGMKKQMAKEYGGKWSSKSDDPNESYDLEGELVDENVSTGKARRARFGGIQSKPVGAVSNTEKAAEYAKQSAAKKAKEKSAGEEAYKAASAKGLSPAEAEMRRKAAERKAARMRKEEVEQVEEGVLDDALKTDKKMGELHKKVDNDVKRMKAGKKFKEEVEPVDEIFMSAPASKKQDPKKNQKKETWYDRDERKRKERKEEFEQVEEGLTDLQRRRYLGRKPGESKERLKRSNERKDKKAALAAMMKQYKGMKAGIYSSYEPEGELVDEKLNLKKEKMGDVIKDFYKSDAPQFKGKSKEKRREMAIAAKLTAERGGRKLGEATSTQNDPVKKKQLANLQMMMRKKQDLERRTLQMKKKGNMPISGLEEEQVEEGIGMTMAGAIGNPPALSKRMKLKQALINREIKKNVSKNKNKKYSGKAASEE